MRLKASVWVLTLVFLACKEKSAPPAPAAPAEASAPAPAAAPAPPVAAPAKPAAAAPPAAAEADEGPFAWTIHSGDAAATLRQKPTSPGKCYLECVLGDDTTAWKATGACFGEKSDRKFLADDCVRTVVMIAAPPRGEAWRKTQVMRVYKKDKLDYPVVGIAALPDEKLMKVNRSWLKGCYGLDGEPPRYSADGQAIEYDTIDGKHHSVPLKK